MPPPIYTILPKPLLWKGGACCKSVIYLTCGERNVCLHSSLRHAINSVQIEKLRDRRSSFGGGIFVARVATLLGQEGFEAFGWVLRCWEQCLLGLFVPLCLHLYLLDWQNVMLDGLKCQWWQCARDIYATFCEFFCLVHRLPIIISSSATNGSAPKSVK